MSKFHCAVAAAVVGFVSLAPQARAETEVMLDLEPDCPYGYFDYAPYGCAPYGYYGPEWFVGGVFVGAGPWFHGRPDFHGHVDNRFDVHHGYRGPFPERGDPREEGRRLDHIENFRGNEVRDGHGMARMGRR